MRVPLTWALPSVAHGVEAIAAEVEANGTIVDKEALHYVLRSRAGSSSQGFPNSPWARDCDASGVRADRCTSNGDGMELSDFVDHPRARASHLGAAHVLALRLYTTAAFRSINEPLRQPARTSPHPLPITVGFLKEAINQMRNRDSQRDSYREETKGSSPSSPSDRRASEASLQPTVLWRGLKDLRVTDEFVREGGTELAPMVR